MPRRVTVLRAGAAGAVLVALVSIPLAGTSSRPKPAPAAPVAAPLPVADLGSVIAPSQAAIPSADPSPVLKDRTATGRAQGGLGDPAAPSSPPAVAKGLGTYTVGATELPASDLAGDKSYRLASTGEHFFELAAAPPRRTDTANRPLFVNRGLNLVRYGGVIVSAVDYPSLVAMMNALHAEGKRLGDISATYARVVSGWRPDAQGEGDLYLAALKTTIASGGYPAFPTDLEAAATGDLGRESSPAFQQFLAALGSSPGWTPALAQRLVDATGQFKAPRGASAHHSGLAVDIDWPVLVDGRLVYHSESRFRQDAALHTVAGWWLYRYAPSFGFDTYDTGSEIWHWEFRRWAFAS